MKKFVFVLVWCSISVISASSWQSKKRNNVQLSAIDYEMKRQKLNKENFGKKYSLENVKRLQNSQKNKI